MRAFLVLVFLSLSSGICLAQTCAVNPAPGAPPTVAGSAVNPRIIDVKGVPGIAFDPQLPAPNMRCDHTPYAFNPSVLDQHPDAEVARGIAGPSSSGLHCGQIVYSDNTSWSYWVTTFPCTEDFQIVVITEKNGQQDRTTYQYHTNAHW